MQRIGRPGSPAGLRRALFRLPVYLYRLRLGWLFGRRLVLINHIGRRTGRVRQVVVEVVKRDPQTGDLVVASGFGPAADWFRNLLIQPEVTVQLATRRMTVNAVPLSVEDGAEVMADYARRHPRAAKMLARFMGFDIGGKVGDYRAVGREIPFLRLEPRA